MNFKYSGKIVLGHDSFFIRLTDKPNSFVHFEGDNPENPNEEVVYPIIEKMEGAAIFHKKQALRFIKETKANNLEIVLAKTLLPKDNSEN